MRRISHLNIAVLFAIVALPAQGIELGHFSPAVARIRDVIQPPPGNYFALYNLYYTTDTYKNGNGDKVGQATVGPITLDVDIDIDNYMIIPAYLGVTDTKIFGANYGFYVSQPIGNMSIDAAIRTNIDRGISFSEDRFGLGDTFISPLWLGWHYGQQAVTFNYGVYAPTGKYDIEDRGNVGLGYWTHQFQSSLAHYVDEKKATALIGLVTYEINHNRDGVDIRPGDRFSLKLGVDQYLPISEKMLGNISLIGYGQWQVTEDSGDDATRVNVKDQIYGAGITAGITYLPFRGQASLQWIHELEAEDRFEGDYFILAIGRPF